VKIPSHRSDLAGQARAFAWFAKQAAAFVAQRDYDLVFATSSRLMTAALGAWIARRKSAALYLDIRDIFVDTMRELLPRPVAWPFRHAFSLVEGWTMRRADRINLVSRGFEQYFLSRYGDRRFSWFTNGIDDEFLALASGRVETALSADTRKTVLYAGNIGDGQALHRILPEMAWELRDHARFVVIGDGGRRKELVRAVAARGAQNFELRGPVSRKELVESYRAADVLFLHLGDQAAFHKVLPSKIFEYAALGKPILAGVAGYAAQFIRDEISNAAVFAPCDWRVAANAFRSLRLVDEPRTEFMNRYSRARITRALADDVVSLARSEALP
jgi:glycosyltransferase involved in cell wall biosynthesis